MKIKFTVENLDCANCAAKIEDAVSKINGVNSVSVSFMTLKMTLDISGENSEEILKEITKVVKKVEPDANLIKA